MREDYISTSDLYCTNMLKADFLKAGNIGRIIGNLSQPAFYLTL